MNKVQWLQESRIVWSGKGRGNYRKKKFTAAAEPHRSVLVNVTLPRSKQMAVESRLPSPSAPHIYVLMPQGHPRRKRLPNSGNKRVSPALISLFSLLATVFAAMGILQIMISTMHLSAYGQTGLGPSVAAHKPGSGPSPEDAVDNEYQHALTRERIAAADTNIVSPIANGNLQQKGLLDEVQVSSPVPQKRGAARQVRIYNGTRSTIDKVIVQLDILNKSGHLVRSETLTADTLSPLAVRVLDVKQVDADNQVHCYIQEIRSKSLRTSLRGL